MDAGHFLKNNTMCAEHIGIMTRHCTAYESKHRTLKTTYQEMIILVNRVRHPRVQGKTCTKRGKETERLYLQIRKMRYTLVSRTLERSSGELVKQ